jgi:DNA helicase HerA-like ATPase
MKHPIPNDALDDRLAFLGTAGSGKTYNAGAAVERVLARKGRVVIIDPLDVWWGLRLTPDGKKASDFDVAIFGGRHGDLPLTEHAGALIGETVATMQESCIVSLGGFSSSAADRRFMLAFLEAIYRKASGEPFHLVVDEADLFAPQKPQKGDEKLLHFMEQIVRRGRIKGFIPWLISQRPAVLNKNVLSQADGLIAFKLTS